MNPIRLDEALALRKTLVDQTLASTPAPFRPRTEYLTKAHGKFLRAQAVLICAQEETGVKPAAAKAAAAVELLHLATLVHDDVIDNADTRRKQPTLMKKFGSKQAVITGDYIFCLALRLAAEAAVHEKEIDDERSQYLWKKSAWANCCKPSTTGISASAAWAICGSSPAKPPRCSRAASTRARVCAAPRKKDVRRYASIGWHLGMIFPTGGRLHGL